MRLPSNFASLVRVAFKTSLFSLETALALLSSLDWSWRTCSAIAWTRPTKVATASSDVFSSPSKRLLSSVNWEIWLAKLDNFPLSILAISAWRSLRAWLRADLSTDFLAIASFSDPTSCDFSECPSVGGTPSVRPLTATPTFSVLAVAGETVISALATPFAKKMSAAIATLAAPKWYFLIE